MENGNRYFIEKLSHLNRDPVTALTLNNLGALLKMEGLYEEAEDCYREALKIRQ
jgi:tetratricopeptide (TPR) repeat protein